ncbi:acyl-CoA reductase-like NAD-dependent aldehyde dehydrogenase [Catenulispora sp. MAP12-49]|uniref:aldehyde dehydrogenase family protein n=1 Tax=unclassified Catenulispora TaxID=414885 RepID=UPI0035130C11
MSPFEDVESILGTIPRGPIAGGQTIDGDGTISVVDPATEEVLVDIAAGTVDTALVAVDAAEQAMPSWAAASPRHRSDVLRRAYELMVARSEALARLIVLENGKALADARGEVAYAAEFFRWGLGEARWSRVRAPG